MHHSWTCSETTYSKCLLCTNSSTAPTVQPLLFAPMAKHAPTQTRPLWHHPRYAAVAYVCSHSANPSCIILEHSGAVKRVVTTPTWLKLPTATHDYPFAALPVPAQHAPCSQCTQHPSPDSLSQCSPCPRSLQGSQNQPPCSEDLTTQPAPPLSATEAAPLCPPSAAALPTTETCWAALLLCGVACRLLPASARAGKRWWGRGASGRD